MKEETNNLKVIKETHKRSMIKSVIWRLIGVVVLSTITYLVTKNWIQTGLITIIHHISFLLGYYAHERFWVWIGDRVTGKKKYIYRVILYEIILGFLVLGTITWLITSSWLAVSLITPIYIFNKIWMYVVYDKIWNKVKWGKK